MIMIKVIFPGYVYNAISGSYEILGHSHQGMPKGSIIDI